MLNVLIYNLLFTCKVFFHRYFYDQLKKAVNNQESIFQWNKKNGKFTLKPGIRFHLFSSHTPCESYFRFRNDMLEIKDSQFMRIILLLFSFLQAPK